MNGQHGSEQGGHQGGQAGQDSHLSFLLNAANGQMGYPGGGGGGGGGLRYGDASLEEQILQRASALRAEALMQQQQQQHQQQRQHQLGAALAAFQQQQQLSSLGLNPNIAALMEARGAQEQEALLHRAAALRELGLSGGGAGGHQAGGMERLQQLEMVRLEELERRRQQLAALANLSNSGRGSSEAPHGLEQLGQDSSHSTPLTDKKARRDSTASTEKAKDDLRKTPGTVIVPCRARGMPMDHNFKTAYFVISEDAKHGEDLVCSYFACRNGGVKFRYCAHCMAPVAKRNFCRRHDHGLSAKAGEGENQEDEEASIDHSEKSVDKGKPDSAPSSSKEKPKTPSKEKDMPGSSLDVLSKAATSSFLMQTVDQQKKRKKPSPEEEKVDAVLSQPAITSDQDADAADLASISVKRRNMWSALLIKRPRTKDPRHLSSWLNEVLTVSDFETPLESPEVAQPKVARSEASADKKVATAEKSKKPREPEAPSNEANGSSKEKKNGEKEKKRRKMESPKSSEDGSNSSKGDRKSKKEERVFKKSGEKKLVEKRTDNGDKKASKKSSKDSPSKKPEDGFVGSFADWRDRKKKGGGSLRK